MVFATITRMTIDEALAGIDAVRWAEVEGCGESAVNVPRHIRDLCSPVEGVRQEAWSELVPDICNQGTRYPATHLAVPFLARLVQAPTVPDRHEIVCLLAWAAVGDERDHFPAGFDADGARSHLADLRSHSAESWERHVDDWVHAAIDDRDRARRERHRSFRRLATSIEYAELNLRAYEAVRTCIPGLRRLLHDHDERVRGAAAYLLGWIPDEAAASVAALTALLARDPAPAVVVSGLISLGLLSRGSSSVVTPYLDCAEAPVRWAAAISLVASGSVDGTVIARLGEALDSDYDHRDGLLIGDCEFSSCAADCLAAISGEHADAALDAALDAYRTLGGNGKSRAARAAVASAFPEPVRSPRPSFAGLDPRQQRVLRALVAEGPGSPRRDVPYGRLRQLGMPMRYDDLAAYITAAG